MKHEASSAYRKTREHVFMNETGQVETNKGCNLEDG